MIVLTKDRMNAYKITNVQVDEKDVITFINGKRIVLGTYNEPYEVLKKIDKDKDKELFIMPLYK